MNFEIDLPNLESIEIGRYALEGNEDDELCSLTLQSMFSAQVLNRFTFSTIDYSL